MSQVLVNNKSEKYGISATLFAALLWGTTGTAATFAPAVSPLAIGSFSMGVGGLLLALLGFKNLRNDGALLLKQRKLITIGAIALAIYPLAFYSSMRFSGVAIGTVISIASAPFFVALIECLFSKQNNIDTRWVVSLFIGVLGIVFLVGSESHNMINVLHESHKYWGILLGFLAGLTYALYSWAAKSLINQGISSQAAMGGIFGFGALLLMPILILNSTHLFATTTNTLVVLYMAIVPMFIGYICFGYGLKNLHASKATLLTLFEPVVAAIFAVLVVGESISLLGWFGVILIMTCLLLQSKK